MIAIMIIGFLMNINVLLPFKNEHFIQRGWVKSISAYYAGHERKLSLLQQGEMIRLLNESAPLEKSLPLEEKPHLTCDRLVIHRYSLGDIELTFAGTCNGRTVLLVKKDEQQPCLLQADPVKIDQILAGNS